MSSSSIGTIRGSTSRIVALEPNRANIDANSTPTAPEPITTSDFGTSVSSRIESDDRIVLWSISMPGSDARRGAGREDDVLRGIGRLRAVRGRHRDAARAGKAPESRGDVHAILLHQIGDAVRALADDLLLVLHGARQIQPDVARRDADVGAMPSSSSRSAVWSRAFVGMQPRRVQTPPSRGSRSTISTDIPSCEARIAAT